MSCHNLVTDSASSSSSVCKESRSSLRSSGLTPEPAGIRSVARGFLDDEDSRDGDQEEDSDDDWEHDVIGEAGRVDWPPSPSLITDANSSLCCWRCLARHR